MATQGGRNVGVFFKAQPTLGTPVNGAGASAFRFNDSTAGMNPQKAKVRSSESRSDGMSTLGRHGSRSVAGVYPADATLGTFESLIEAVLRGTYSAVLTITEATASLTSITTTTNTIVAAAGSWITAGLKKGDVIVLTNHSTAGNNSKNLRIVDLTTSTITLPANSLILNAVADTAFTITRAKKVMNGTTRRLFTFEEREEDTNASVLYPDCRVSSFKVAMGPDAMVKFEFGIVGRDFSVLSGAASPNFSSPVMTTTVPLVCVDATIRLGSSDIATITSLDFMMNLNAKGQPVSASNISPDVYENNMAPIAGSFSAIREDMALLSSFIAEDQLSLHMLLVEPDVEPKDYMSFYLPLLTLDGNTKNFGVDGPLIQTVPFEAGKMLSGANVDNVMACVQSTAAP